MRVFVTGATGFVGTVVVEELMRRGHTVLGLSRSEMGDARLRRVGATVHRGSIEDLKSLRAGARAAEAVIHCAFDHDLSRFAASSEAEARAITALGESLIGSKAPLVVTSGVALMSPGRSTTEDDARPPDVPIPRDAETPTLALVARGVRAMLVRLSPVTHGNGTGGFAGLLIEMARANSRSAYVGEGANRWAAVHHRDAAKLYVDVLERGTPGMRYHAVAEEGVTTKAIATAIGAALNLPVESLSGDRAAAHFGNFVHFAGLDTTAKSELTRQRLGWRPTHSELVEDLRANLRR